MFIIHLRQIRDLRPHKSSIVLLPEIFQKKINSLRIVKLCHITMICNEGLTDGSHETLHTTRSFFAVAPRPIRRDHRAARTYLNLGRGRRLKAPGQFPSIRNWENRVIGDAPHARGIKAIVWFEPERGTPGSWTVISIPSPNTAWWHRPPTPRK
jgi:hypothetical protein